LSSNKKQQRPEIMWLNNKYHRPDRIIIIIISVIFITHAKTKVTPS